MKKLSLAILIALLAALATFSFASANADTDQRALIGQVLEISADHFTVENRNGKTFTIQVTGETAFRSRSGDQPHTASFADLQVGQWVSVVNTDANENATARLVVILPDDFDPESLEVTRAAGEVGKINNGQSTFDLTTRSGETLTFTVDGSTHFYGSIAELSDLEKGMTVGVVAIPQEDGTLLAKLVANQRRSEETIARAAGMISEINATRLTLTTREGETLSFTLSTDTHFTSRDESLTSLNDLAAGMAVVVAYPKTEAEPPTANSVTAFDQTLLNLERTAGTVQSANNNQLKLETFNGETLTFSINDSTHLFGQGLTNMQDLKNGMKVLVMYETDGDNLSAVAIAARTEKGE